MTACPIGPLQVIYIIFYYPYVFFSVYCTQFLTSTLTITMFISRALRHCSITAACTVYRRAISYVYSNLKFIGLIIALMVR